MPTQQPPIACSLTASEMPVRLAEMADIGRAALLNVDAAERCATLRFKADTETRTRVETVIAAESQCCAFLDMALTDERGAIVLTVTAPAGAGPVLDELIAAFSSQRQAA